MSQLGNFIKGLSVATTVGGALYFFAASRQSRDMFGINIAKYSNEL